MNYIDIGSRMQIETLIRQHMPTMLLVEHDRAFQEAIGGTLLQLESERRRIDDERS